MKAKKGSAGVDGESIEEFEKDLKNNLYKALESDVFGELFSTPGDGWWRFRRTMEASGR